MSTCLRAVSKNPLSLHRTAELLPLPLPSKRSGVTGSRRVSAAAKGEAEFMKDSTKFQKLQGVKVTGL